MRITKKGWVKKDLPRFLQRLGFDTWWEPLLLAAIAISITAIIIGEHSPQ